MSEKEKKYRRQLEIISLDFEDTQYTYWFRPHKIRMPTVRKLSFKLLLRIHQKANLHLQILHILHGRIPKKYVILYQKKKLLVLWT